MGKLRRKASLHAATAALHSKGTAFSSLPRRNAMKPGHLHKTPEALLACPAIARRVTADEDGWSCRLRREDVFLFTAHLTVLK